MQWRSRNSEELYKHLNKLKGNRDKDMIKVKTPSKKKTQK